MIDEDAVRIGMKVWIRVDLSDACWDSISLPRERVEGRNGRVMSVSEKRWDVLTPDGGRCTTRSCLVHSISDEHIGFFPPYALEPSCMFRSCDT